MRSQCRLHRPSLSPNQNTKRVKRYIHSSNSQRKVLDLCLFLSRISLVSDDPPQTPAFYAERDPKQAECSSKYMQQLFPFVGLMTARRRTLQKEMFTQLPQPLDHQTLQDIVFALWYLPEREFQHLGCDIMKEKGEAAGWYSSTEQAGEQALHTIELLIRSKSWWDTIDLMASQMLSQLLSSHRHLIVRMDQWITDDCLWIRRAALVFQLPYYQLPAMADFPRLCRYIKLVGHQKEFFIQKAIGWSLRQFSKSPQLVDEVRAFVAANRCELTPLAVREASKYL